jgi:flagellar protein FlbB
MYSRVGAAPRILVLVLLLVVLFFGGVLWFDYLGIIDAKDTFAPVLSLLGLQRRDVIETPEDPYLLEIERYNKRMEGLLLKEEELDNRAASLDEKANELEALQAELQQKEKALTDKEKSFNERVRLYENERANLEQNARNLVSMRPDDAVAVLLALDDQEIIDVLRVTQELADEAGELSLVSVWLARFPAERAATIMRKMALKPLQ